MQLGAKDIRKDLRKKRHLDRLENATNELDDEVSFATFLAQGEHELKLEHLIQNVFSLLLQPGVCSGTVSKSVVPLI